MMTNKMIQYILTGVIDATGALVVTSDEVIRGKVHKVMIDYPAGTVAVKLESTGIVDETILDLGVANTDKVYYPIVTSSGSAGADVNIGFDDTDVTVYYEKPVVYGKLKLTCASGTATQVVKVGIIVEVY